ncbi:MAG: SDR family NAD(P)-dependent oxidoreductase [Candidatus Aminicenantes bacterium]|jgi:polyketide synthase PksL
MARKKSRLGDKPVEKPVIKTTEFLPEPAIRPCSRIEILNRLKSGDLDPAQALQLINQAQEQKKSHQLMVFRSQWQGAPLAAAPGEPTILADMIVFDSDTRLAEALRRRLPGCKVALVKPGAAYAEKDNLVFEIDALDPGHYQKLVERLIQLEVKPVYLVHRWSTGAFTTELPVLDNQLKTGFYSLFYLCQALLTHKVGPVIRLLYVYPLIREEASPAYSAVSGFARSVRRENPGFLVKTLGLSERQADSAVSLEDLLLAELDIRGDRDIEVRYHKNSRQIHRYLPYSEPQPGNAPLPLKQGGVYLVTGGAGGLGMIFSRYLVERFSPRVVLVGRSGLSPEKQEQIDRLRQNGADVTYTRADISQPQEVEQLIRDVKTRFRTIDGVIHSAGVNRDAFLLNKTRAQIDEVLAAKVFGTVCLARELEQDPLGVFVLFSSGAAVMGNAGQCDYAFANGFMDHFARWWRNRHPNSSILSINWPLWQEGGMQIPRWERQHLFKQAGITALPTQPGLDAWENALRSDTCHYIVFYGEKRFHRYLNPPVVQQGNHNVREKTQTFLKEIFSELFCLPMGKLDIARTFQEYGVDSIIVNQFNAKMETHLGPLSKTLLYEYRTIKDLIDYFIHHHEAKLVNFFGLREEAPGVSLKQPGPTVPSPSNRDVTGSGTVSRQEKGTEAAVELEDIAVIGMSGRYAFAANLEEFWGNLLEGKDCITEVPAHRWDVNAYYDPDPAKASEGKMYCKWGSFLEDADKFDPLFFSISPREAENMDPQERLFLEIAWTALEDAGYSRQRLHRDIPQNQGANVGVFAGITSYTYLLWGPDEWRKGNNVIPNSVPWTIANRVSYVFDLNGPSLPVDTACSSSLTAVHLACESLKRRECHMAIAGGVNLYLHPAKYINMCQVNMLSPTGRCHSFGAASDGFVPGEGVGAVVLKPLSLARRDRDRVYAVIKGSSINHGGATSGYTVPNPNAQARVILETIKKARVNPRAIGFIEAHGTGTRLGDPIEIAGLSKTFRQYTPDNQFCAIGTVKTNIGHLEAAAGIAGLTKVILQMKHRQLVPSLHSQSLNPNIDFSATPFTVQQHLADWDRPVIEENGRQVTYPRIAGISSFGAGGANAHIILQEYEGEPANTDEDRDHPGPQIFVLSARTEERLKVYAGEIAAHLEKITTPGVKNPLPCFYNRLQEVLVKAAAEIINVEPGEINPGDDLADIGFDEVKWAALADRLAGTYGLDLNPLLLFQHASPAALAVYLEGTHGEVLAAYYGQPTTQKKAGPSPNPDPAADVAYTLQVGREPLDHRLALVTTHLDQLKEKLSHYAQGNKNIDNIYSGSASVDKERALLVLDGEEAREFLHTLIRNNKPDKLAQLWACGVDIDWTLLPRQGQRSIISLPTYPFEKKRYWFDGFLNEKPAVPPREVAADAAGTSDLAARLKANSAFYSGSEVILNIIDESIALVTMQAKESRNMFTENMIEGLMAHFDEICRHPSLKVVIITGYDNIFCMGGTQEQLLRISDHVNKFSDLPFLYRGILDMDLPVIAAMQGHASGGGMLFGLYSDIVIMAEEAVYSAVFMKYGFTPGMGATFILDERLGGNLAREMMFTARSYRGEELKNRGANILFKKQADVLPEAITIARMLAEKPVKALKVLKKELSGNILQKLLVHIDREEKMHELTFNDTEVKERINYYYGKSWPVNEEAGQTGDFTDDRITEPAAGRESTARMKDKPVTAEPSLSIPPAPPAEFDEATVCPRVINIVSQVLHIPAGEIRREVPFKELGADSISGVEIIRDINKTFNLTLEAVAIYDYATIDALASCVSRELASHAESRQWVTAPRDLSSSPPSEAAVCQQKKIQDTVANPFVVRQSADTYDRVSGGFPAAAPSIDLSPPSALQTVSEVQPPAPPADKISLKGDISNGAPMPPVKAQSIKLKDKKTGDLSALDPAAPSHQPPVMKLKSTTDSPQPGIARDDTAGQEHGNPTLDIAIIGMSGRFAGAKNLDEFWRNLVEGVCSITEVPGERWDIDRYYDPNPKTPNKTYSRWMGVLPAADCFDSLFFNISPREAELMDPQHRVFMEEAWRALEDAGYSPNRLSGQKCGIFVGAGSSNYDFYMNLAGKSLDSQLFMGSYLSFLSARLAYLLNLTGPNLVLDTACSSSLVAVHLGAMSIIEGDSDIVLAGGVSVLLTPYLHIVTSKAELLAPDGVCKTFDNSADGLVPAEGVGVVVLKALDKALADGDHIYGVIRGSGVNQDGKTNGITAPSADSQSRLETEVYNRFHIYPGDISCVEAHGTGTKLGDPIEVSALTRTFRQFTREKQFCSIGSVKANIGHALTASGAASIIKILLCLKHKKLVPSLHFNTPNEHIPFADSPFYVQRKPADWPSASQKPRLAAVSSFGLSGTNCHMVIAEPPSPGKHQGEKRQPYYLVPLSAKKNTALKQKMADLLTFLESGNAPDRNDLVYTLQQGRSHFPVRAALVVKDLDELITRLHRVLHNGTAPDYIDAGCKKETGAAGDGINLAERILDELLTLPASAVDQYREGLLTLANIYVQGEEIAWSVLCPGSGHRRISLPTYPFNGQRYWLPGPEAGSGSAFIGPGAASLHPLLDANVSTLEEQQYIKVFTGTEFFLTDHVVKEKKILPGVAYLEMARAAGDLAQPRAQVKLIKNIVWLQPIIVENGPLPTFISLYPGNDTVAFEISSGAEQNRVVYAQGVLEYGEITGPSRGLLPDPIDIQAILQRCPRRLEADDCYRTFQQFGFHYGPGFRPIQWLAAGRGEALAFLEIPEPYKKDSSTFKLHPTLLDGALQSTAGLFLDDTAGLGTLATYIPFSLGEMCLLSPGSTGCYAYAKFSEPLQPYKHENIKRFTISLSDEKGQIWAVLKDYSLRPADSLESISPKTTSNEKEDILRKLQAGTISIQAAKKLLGVQS